MSLSLVAQCDNGVTRPIAERGTFCRPVGGEGGAINTENGGVKEPFVWEPTTEGEYSGWANHGTRI